MDDDIKTSASQLPKKVEKKAKPSVTAKKTVTKKKSTTVKPKADKLTEKKTKPKTSANKKEPIAKKANEESKSETVEIKQDVKLPEKPLSRNNPVERRRPIDLSDIKPSTKYIYQLKSKRTIVGLTAYDAIMSKLVSKAGVDFILVGDSVGTTMLGYETTIPVTIDDMVHHTAAVRRGLPGCLVVADLPFGEASLSFDRLLDSARRLMQCGADAVKIEGGKDVADDIEKLVATGIPVMGHIGLLPQTVKAIGGYRKFGTNREEADDLYTDAISLEEAGCFAIIAEMMDEQIATKLAAQILPPLIGIGSGHQTDGQILVTHDLLGLTPSPLPSFVKPCATLGLDGLNALRGYVQNLRSRKVNK